MRTPFWAVRRDRRFGQLLVLLLCANLATTGVLGVSLYLRAERSAREQAIESNRLILSQLNRSVDVVLAEFDKSFASLILDFSVAGFLDYYRDRDYLMMSRVYQSLYDFLAVNRFVNSLSIYYREADIVVSPHRGVTATSDFYDRELIREILAGTRATGWLPLREVPDTATDRPIRVLTVVKPIPLVYYSPRALIIVTIREQFLSDIVGSIQAGSEGTIIVVTSSGAVLGRPFDDAEAAVASRVATSGRDPAGGAFFASGGRGGRTLVSFMPSRRYPWTYVYALPYRAVVAWVDSLRAWWLAAVLFTVVLGIAVSVVISGLSYSAVSRLAARFSRGPPLKGARDLLGYIGEGIDELRRRADDAEALLEGARPGLRNAFLLRLLKGSADSPDILAERFDYYGLRAHTYPALAVLLVRPDDAEEFRVRYTEHEKNLLSVRFDPLVSSLLPQGAAADVLDDDPMEIRIILGLQDRPVATLEAFARLLHDKAVELLDHPVTVGVSEAKAGLADVPRAYREASRAIGYRVVLGGNRVIAHAEISSAVQRPLEYPFAEERKLLDGLKAGDIELAEGALDRVLPNGEAARSASPQQARFRQIQLLCTIMSFVSDIGGSSALLADGDLFGGLLSQGSPAAAREWFLTLFGRIVAFIEQSRSERNERLVRGVEEYVRANYDSRDLSLVRIADAVYYSVPHVCRVFREATGVSVKEFVNRVRIDRAKELLATPGLSVSAVAGRVGYGRLQSFSKLFKKQLGLTPGDYRRLRRAP